MLLGQTEAGLPGRFCRMDRCLASEALHLRRPCGMIKSLRRWLAKLDSPNSIFAFKEILPLAIRSILPPACAILILWLNSPGVRVPQWCSTPRVAFSPIQAHVVCLRAIQK